MTDLLQEADKIIHADRNDDYGPPRKDTNWPLTLDYLREFATETAEGCWEWRRARAPGGYGVVRRRQRNFRVHRLALELTGVRVQGKVVCHRCDNPPCFNPEHLFVGTPADNMRDAYDKGRLQTPRPRRGRENPAAKLTDARVREIRKLHRESRVSQSELARRFGMHQSTISDIVRGELWKHVP